MKNRSFIWLPKSVPDTAYYECTKFLGHFMKKTAVNGSFSSTRGTTLWVCPDCEPLINGRWLADIDLETIVEKERKRSAAKTQIRRKAKARLTNHHHN